MKEVVHAVLRLITNTSKRKLLIYMGKEEHTVLQRRCVDTAGASVYTGIPKATLRKFRYEDRGPKYFKPAGRVLYDVAELDRFMESSVRIPSARASKEPKRNVAV